MRRTARKALRALTGRIHTPGKKPSSRYGDRNLFRSCPPVEAFAQPNYLRVVSSKRWSALPDLPRHARAIVVYIASMIAGGTLAVLATEYAVRDNVYVMFAVLLVVAAALAGGPRPPVLFARTSLFRPPLRSFGRLHSLYHV